MSLPTPSQGVGVLYPFSALPTPPVAASVCPPTDIASGSASPQGNAPVPQVVPISVSCRQLPASQVLGSYTYFFLEWFLCHKTSRSQELVGSSF